MTSPATITASTENRTLAASAAAAVGLSSSSNNATTSPQKKTTAITRRDLNPRWAGYFSIALFSVIGFSAVNEVDVLKFDMTCNVNSNITTTSQKACWVFSLVSFLTSGILVLVDLFNR